MVRVRRDVKQRKESRSFLEKVEGYIYLLCVIRCRKCAFFLHIVLDAVSVLYTIMVHSVDIILIV